MDAPTLSIMIYMAKCPSSGCNDWNAAGKVWFKIFHEGLISGTQNAGIWAGDQLVDTLDWEVTIPRSLAPGEYLIRHELLALHQANNPQFYPECAQLTVTGSGTSSPPSSLIVAFPGAYSASDPGVAFNIDSHAAMKATTYPVPGPAVWEGTSNAPPAGEDPAPAPEPTTMATVVTPQPTQLAFTPIKRYRQSGGANYDGCKVCESGSTCTKNGDYYSQCM